MIKFKDQLRLWETKNVNCPFSEFIEDWDIYCYQNWESDFETISENEQLPYWLADVNNIGFENIIAKPISIPELPPFIPVIKHGSAKIVHNNKLPFVAVSLGDIISQNNLSVIKNLRKRFGTNKETKIILLSNAKDRLIEKIWPRYHEVIKNISNLKLNIVTAIDYSVFLKQPHAERFVNQKRSLITFKEFQKHKVPTIPHLYWSGKKDLKRWINWLNKNRSVEVVSINLQTERGKEIWSQTLKDLDFLSKNIGREIRYFINGPSTPQRIKDIKKIFPLITLSNKRAFQEAASGFLLTEKSGNLIKYRNEHLTKDRIFFENINFYNSLVNRKV